MFNHDSYAHYWSQIFINHVFIHEPKFDYFVAYHLWRRESIIFPTPSVDSPSDPGRPSKPHTRLSWVKVDFLTYVPQFLHWCQMWEYIWKLVWNNQEEIFKVDCYTLNYSITHSLQSIIYSSLSGSLIWGETCFYLVFQWS